MHRSFGDKSEPPMLETAMSSEAEFSDTEGAEGTEGADAPAEGGVQSGAGAAPREGQVESQHGVNDDGLAAAAPCESLPAVEGLTLDEDNTRDGDHSEDDPRSPQGINYSEKQEMHSAVRFFNEQCTKKNQHSVFRKK